MTETKTILRVGEYVRNPRTGMIHVKSAIPAVTRTMCGVPMSTLWVSGDETISGIAATCGKCRRLMGRPR